MLFARSRWARTIVTESGLSPASPAGRSLADLLAAGARTAEKVVGPSGGLDDLDLVVKAARALPGDAMAEALLVRTAGLTRAEAAAILERAAQAAIRCCQANGHDLSPPRPQRIREPWSPKAG